MDLILDLSESGLKMFFKPYQISCLELLWNSKKPLGSRDIWEGVNQMLPSTISRASIINFLDASVENGILDYTETTGKGGYRRLYIAAFSKEETSEYLSWIVKNRLKTLPNSNE